MGIPSHLCFRTEIRFWTASENILCVESLLMLIEMQKCIKEARKQLFVARMNAQNFTKES